MSADLLHLLARFNLAGAAAILLVLLIAAPLRRALGARAAYRLWLSPPLVALASLVPFPTGGAGVLPPLVLVAPRSWTAPVADAAGWPSVAVLVWAAGAAAWAVLLMLRQRRFIAALGDVAPVRIGGRRVMRSVRSGVGPAVVGAVIVVPADFEVCFTPAEQEAILAHEAQHLARGDVLANGLIAFAQCLCWFNPLVHLAVRRMRLDQELACDAAVIEARPAMRRVYAEALLKTQVLADVPPFGCAWPARSRHPLKQRIAMLGAARPNAPRRALGLILLGAVVLGGGYAAWAGQAGPAGRLIQPDWVQRPDGFDLVRFYPAEAMRLKQEGMAVAECQVQASGQLSRCKVLRQAPEGAGFGEATLNMTPLFRMRPLSRDGVPVAGGVVRIPVLFKLAPPQGS